MIGAPSFSRPSSVVPFRNRRSAIASTISRDIPARDVPHFAVLPLRQQVPINVPLSLAPRAFPQLALGIDLLRPTPHILLGELGERFSVALGLPLGDRIASFDFDLVGDGASLPAVRPPSGR